MHILAILPRLQAQRLRHAVGNGRLVECQIDDRELPTKAVCADAVVLDPALLECGKGQVPRWIVAVKDKVVAYPDATPKAMRAAIELVSVGIGEFC